MLLTIALVVASSAVDLAGMPPQIDELRRMAKANDLPVLCTGRMGEEQVIRIGFQEGTNPSDVSLLKAKLFSVSNRLSEVPNDKIDTRHCDLEPVMSYVDDAPPFDEPKLLPATHDITFGPIAALAPLLPVAVACGFEHAQIRPMADYDRDFIGRATNAPKIGPDWQTLDGGERIWVRTGPMLCFRKLGAVGNVPNDR
jgi:hypothetical protein